jgi:hypothetical protein
MKKPGGRAQAAYAVAKAGFRLPPKRTLVEIGKAVMESGKLPAAERQMMDEMSVLFVDPNRAEVMRDLQGFVPVTQYAYQDGVLPCEIGSISSVRIIESKPSLRDIARQTREGTPPEVRRLLRRIPAELA